MKSATCSSPSGTELATTPERGPVAASRLKPGGARAGLSFLFLALSLAAPAAPDKAKSDTAAKAPAAPVEMEIPQSVFVIPAGPREGRNPFFPRSVVAAPVVQRPKETVLDTSNLVLNGVTSKPIPTVMINGRTFEKGEEHELTLSSGGKVKVRCEEIRQDSALITVNGLQRELRMRSGL